MHLLTCNGKSAIENFAHVSEINECCGDIEAKYLAINGRDQSVTYNSLCKTQGTLLMRGQEECKGRKKE